MVISSLVQPSWQPQPWQAAQDVFALLQGTSDGMPPAARLAADVSHQVQSETEKVLNVLKC